MVESSKGPGAPDGVTALPVHPRTGLTAVGIVGGKPVWPIMGASEDHTGGEPGGQAPQGDQPPATPPAPQQTGQAPAPQSKGTSSMTLEDAQKVIEDLRKENAGHRTANKTAAQQAQEAKEQRDAVLKAFGLTAEGKDAPPDAAALAAQVEQLQAVAWENGAQAAIVRVAAAAGADADSLLDSNSFLDSLGDFIGDDPTSAEFRTKLQAHIKGFVEKNPKLKATPAGPARSGGDHPGGVAPPSARPKSLMDAVSKHFKS